MESQSVRKNLPIPKPTPYFLYMPHSLPVPKPTSYFLYMLDSLPVCIFRGDTKFKIFLSHIAAYRVSNSSKKPSCSQTNFLLPVHATFTSGLHFRGVPPSLKYFFLTSLLIEGQTVRKNLPIPIPTSYFLYTLDSLPVCIFGGCHQLLKVSFCRPYSCIIKSCKKTPSSPKTKFLLPVHARFTSGLHFQRLPSTGIQGSHDRMS